MGTQIYFLTLPGKSKPVQKSSLCRIKTSPDPSQNPVIGFLSELLASAFIKKNGFENTFSFINSNELTKLEKRDLASGNVLIFTTEAMVQAYADDSENFHKTVEVLPFKQFCHQYSYKQWWEFWK